MKTKNNTYCFVGGGSGGHIIPALNLIEQLQEKNPTIKTIFFSSNLPIDTSIIKNQSTAERHIPLNISAPPLKKPWTLPLWMYSMIASLLKSIYWLYKTKPQEVICMGGFTTVPVAAAARLLDIPITLYELNVEPGKATQLLARFANQIHITFKETAQFLPSYTCTLVEYPLGKSITTLQKQSFKKSTKKTLLIIGGSQGSVSLNTFIHDWIKNHHNLWNQLHIVHQTGANDSRNWKHIYDTYNIEHTVFSFKNDIQSLYSKADYIVCRAGAGTLFEIKHLGIPCLVVPLETSYTQHQRYNALAMHKAYPQQFNVLFQQDITSNPEHAHTQLNCFLKNFLANPSED